jgi:3-phenylpropionate/cinnamic acid dioxygenase small subunit
MSDEQHQRALPSAGPDFARLLAQDVVIEGDDGTAARTGAQAVVPDHSPRAPLAGGAGLGAGIGSGAGAGGAGAASSASMQALAVLPRAWAGAGADLQREVEQFLYRQAELLDAKQWQAWIDLFADDGVYWMPARAWQTEWEDSPSIFAEDKLMMEIRKGRITHPNAWSQAPLWETNHIVSHVAIESAADAPGGDIRVRSRFHMMELRRDTIRHFGGRMQHHLVRGGDGQLRIKLQRVDLFNAEAAFDYVIQIWV